MEHGYETWNGESSGGGYHITRMQEGEEEEKAAKLSACYFFCASSGLDLSPVSARFLAAPDSGGFCL